MRDAGGELAERGEFFGLHQAVLRGAEIVEGLRQVRGALLHFLEQLDIRNGDDGLIGEGLQELDMVIGEIAGLQRASRLIAPMGLSSLSNGTTSRLR